MRNNDYMKDAEKASCGKSPSTAGLEVGFEQMAKAMGDMIEMETLISQLAVIGVEYETGNITPERFAKRTHELLARYLRGGTQETSNVKSAS